MKKTIENIQSVDITLTQQVKDYLNTLTKPPGSLGRLENLAVQLAEITGQPFPEVTPPGIIVFAGDHGIVEEGVSAFPQEVTTQMVDNFLNGGSAINVFANQLGALLKVVDVGVVNTIDRKGLVSKKVRFGTRNFAKQDALTREEVEEAIEAGIQVANDVIDEGAQCVIPGEMGIGNTTSSSAILAVISGADISRVVGSGTGITSEALKHKQVVIKQALTSRQPDPTDPIDILSKVGGLEIAAITGAILGAASRQKPVIVDGFIATVAALLAYKLCNYVKDYLIFGHQSQERGHGLALELLDGTPLLNLQFRLGEGTGAAMAFPIVEAATRILGEMATFSSAGVSDGQKEEKQN